MTDPIESENQRLRAERQAMVGVVVFARHLATAPDDLWRSLLLAALDDLRQRHPTLYEAIFRRPDSVIDYQI